ncbi:MAG: hypothetical protein KA247_04960 [Bacteroidetes bacterium]|nr:hypothetical protein [Bacteroidota bacterium]
MSTRIILMLFLAVGLRSQVRETVRYDLMDSFRNDQLTVHNRHVETVSDKNRKWISMSEETGEGLVWLKDVSFSTGTIDIDLKGKDVFQRSFVGIAFHGLNDSTFEAVYFRPFQFHTEDTARKKRAVQYISLPEFTWQRLRSEHPGVYEKPVIPGPDPNEWFHTSLVITEKEILVYVDHHPVPVLRVGSLSGRKTGKIGLYTADRSGGSFSKLSIEHSLAPSNRTK